jgi:hypothetical protein
MVSCVPSHSTNKSIDRRPLNRFFTSVIFHISDICLQWWLQAYWSHSSSCMYFNFGLLPIGGIPYLPPLFLIWKSPKTKSTIYKKNLFKEWFGLHFIECGWYLDCPKDCTPSSNFLFVKILSLKRLKKPLCLKVPKDQGIWLRRKVRKSLQP